MPAPVQQEKGHLYKKEQPSSYHNGQLGQGASIGGKVTAKGGTFLKLGDESASKLKKEWASAGKGGKKFPSF